MKQIIKLTESDLHNIVRESVYQILGSKQKVNEGWKNKALASALGAMTMFGNPQIANAQNPIVDSLKEPNEAVRKEIDRLLLDPNKSIKENYAKIDSMMSLHKVKNLAEYTITVWGHYTTKRGDSSCDWPIDWIYVKGKDNEKYRTISGQIIKVLTELYSHSLGTRFDVDYSDYHTMEVNKKTIKVPTGRTFKRSDGKVTKEYVEKEGYGTMFYSLYPSSPLYKKIYNKVIEETGLKDGGRWYDREQERNKILSNISKTRDSLSQVRTREQSKKPYNANVTRQKAERLRNSFGNKKSEFVLTKNDELNRSDNDDMYYHK